MRESERAREREMRARERDAWESIVDRQRKRRERSSRLLACLDRLPRLPTHPCRSIGTYVSDLAQLVAARTSKSINDAILVNRSVVVASQVHIGVVFFSIKRGKEHSFVGDQRQFWRMSVSTLTNFGCGQARVYTQRSSRCVAVQERCIRQSDSTAVNEESRTNKGVNINILTQY
jgi:hypothetical protein